MNTRQNKKLYSLWLDELEEKYLIQLLNKEYNIRTFDDDLKEIGDIVLTAFKNGELEIR